MANYTALSSRQLKIIWSNLSLISVVLQSMMFQFSDDEFWDLNITEDVEKIDSFLAIKTFSVT